MAELELSSLEFEAPPGKAQAFITSGGQSRPGPRFPELRAPDSCPCGPTTPKHSPLQLQKAPSGPGQPCPALALSWPLGIRGHNVGKAEYRRLKLWGSLGHAQGRGDQGTHASVRPTRLASTGLLGPVTMPGPGCGFPEPLSTPTLGGRRPLPCCPEPQPRGVGGPGGVGTQGKNLSITHMPVLSSPTRRDGDGTDGGGGALLSGVREHSFPHPFQTPS